MFALSGSPKPGGEATEHAALAQADPPNILFILADDLSKQDMRYMPKAKQAFSGGAKFDNAFVTYSICCPSRSTILTGKYGHNHRIHGNFEPYGGAHKFHRIGMDRSTVATWLNPTYDTMLAGKYMNGYKMEHVPPGWDTWRGWEQNYSRKNYLTEDAEVKQYQGMRDGFVERQTRGFITKDRDEPYFAYASFHTPHNPHQYDPKYRDNYTKARAPRTKSFGERNVKDKPKWIQRKAERFNPRAIDRAHRKRARALRTLDDRMQRIVRDIDLSQTVVILTSDNGYKEGQHRLAGKWTGYEEDINIPFYAVGKGVPNKSFPHMVLNNDFGPTMADLAGVDYPETDGTSFAPLLRGEGIPLKNWRKRFIVENFDSEFPKGTPAKYPAYVGLRTKYLSYMVTLGTGERELYSLRRDRAQMSNRVNGASAKMIRRLHRQLRPIRSCDGKECHKAEGFAR